MSEGNPHQKLRVLGWLLHAAGAAVTMLLLTVATLAGLAPQQLLIWHSAHELGRLNDLLARAPQVRSQHGAIERELLRLREQKALLRQRITDGPREDELLQQVSAAAKFAQLQLREYRPGEVAVHGDYGVMTIHLNLEGSYYSICRFLHELAHLPRLNKVRKMQISTANQHAVYPVSMSLEIFFAARHSDTT